MSSSYRVLPMDMRISFLLCVALATTSLCAQPAELVGCIYQDAAGTLWFEHLPARSRQQISGNTSLVLHHLNQIVALAAASATPNSQLAVGRLRVVAESCTSVLPSRHPELVGGKTGIVTDAAPVSSAASAEETTPGFQTESGMQQREGHATPKPEESSAGAYVPLLSEQAGQSEFAADANAQAAVRAEMYPNATLGVDDKGPPPSPGRAIRANAEPEAAH
jgi:hypothetical protein